MPDANSVRFEAIVKYTIMKLEDLKQAREEIIAADERRIASDRQKLEQIHSLTDPELYQIIVDEIEEEECYYNFKIVDSPKGNYDEDMLRWVNQTTNGGFSGDEFAGTIYYALNNGKYFEMRYVM